MASLYEIDAEIMACIDGETGEIIDDEKLAALQMERDKKVENVALWYKNLTSDAAAYKAEKDAFAERERVAKNKAESLKKYLDSALAGQPFKSTRVSVSYRASDAVIVDDVQLIDPAYLKFAEPTPDKTAIKKAIKAGETVDGAHIEQRSNISIK